ncbi:TetR-like C-terminal domain-containing protein [Nocardia sp. NPDC050717]|uniref:TetR-like C-terminal domain-containing protein n=1 Tax=Nocardia sp. NPDC050717 TaxID=3157221 RepID=UPI003411526F
MPTSSVTYETVASRYRTIPTAFTGSIVADCTPALIDAAERNAELRELFHRYNAERRATLVAAVRDGIATGDFPADTDPELAATALAGAVIYRRLMTSAALDPTEVEDLVHTVLGPGVSQSSSPRRLPGEATRE